MGLTLCEVFLVLILLGMSKSVTVTHPGNITIKQGSCEPPCRNGGTCQGTRCVCPKPFKGEDCGMRTVLFTYNYLNQTGDDFNTRTIFQGDQSLQVSCDPPCRNGGVCNTDSTCVCPASYSGKTCAYRDMRFIYSYPNETDATTGLFDEVFSQESEITTIDLCVTHAPAMFRESEDRCRSVFNGACRRVCLGEESEVNDIACLPFESQCKCCSLKPPTEICIEGKQCACRKGFMKIDMQCVMFDFNSYSWESATRICEKHNASLGQIESFEKLVRPMKDNGIPEGEYWLGISFDSTRFEYSWFNGKGSVSGPWAENQPDITLGCVVMCWRGTNTPHLCSRSCTRATTFVCTYDITQWKAGSGGSHLVSLSMGLLVIIFVLQLTLKNITM